MRFLQNNYTAKQPHSSYRDILSLKNMVYLAQQINYRNGAFGFGYVDSNCNHEIPPSFVEIRLVPALQDSIRLVRETGAVICPNLLNRMQNDEGWLTHLFAGVGSQSEIPSANHLHLKGKAKAVTPSLIYY